MGLKQSSFVGKWLFQQVFIRLEFNHPPMVPWQANEAIILVYGRSAEFPLFTPRQNTYKEGD